MQNKRRLNNGATISRVVSPQNPNHHIYYVEGGEEGHLMVFDTYLTDPSIIAACLAWEMDKETLPLPDPRLEFNRRN